MHQTLLFIPHWIFQGPLLIAWLILGVVLLAWRFKQHGMTEEFTGYVPIFLIGAAVIYWVFPQLEVLGINPDDPTGSQIKVGMAVRGYGVCLLLAIVAGVVLTTLRCQRIGVSADQIYQLGLCMVLCGIAGARLFFVIQNSDEFFSNGWSMATLIQVVDMTKGGLVVYGSLIAGTVAGLVFLMLNKMPIWKTADLIAPGMVLGLAIGRLGCLMNGCCFGGVCSEAYPAVTFPPGSPPYMRQLSEGELLGITSVADTESTDAADQHSSGSAARKVTAVQAGSFAALQGIQVDERIRIRPDSSEYIRFRKQHQPQSDAIVAVIDRVNQRQIAITPADLPTRSARTHPTQIYSSINALFLAAVLWFFWTMKRHEGQVFALMLILYSIGRFLMEIVRTDEHGQFGTTLTISQLVSIGTILFGFGLMAFLMTRPASDLNAPLPTNVG